MLDIDTAREILRVVDEILAHSKPVIEICLGLDLAGIADRPEIDSIRTLHEVLKSEYGPFLRGEFHEDRS